MPLFVIEWWVGFGCGWVKLNVLQFRSACEFALQLIFNFAKHWHFVVLCQHKCLMSARPPALQVTFGLWQAGKLIPALCPTRQDK